MQSHAVWSWSWIVYGTSCEATRFTIVIFSFWIVHCSLLANLKMYDTYCFHIFLYFLFIFQPMRSQIQPFLFFLFLHACISHTHAHSIQGTTIRDRVGNNLLVGNRIIYYESYAQPCASAIHSTWFRTVFIHNPF